MWTGLVLPLAMCDVNPAGSTARLTVVVRQEPPLQDVQEQGLQELFLQ